MNPFLLRSLMHAAGLVVAACLFWFLPFSPWRNAVLALVAAYLQVGHHWWLNLALLVAVALTYLALRARSRR